MSHILMICHDQHLDRRVVAQALSLIGTGHKVTLLALSLNGDGEELETSEGIHLVRVGLNQIIPKNITYVTYMARQNKLNILLNKSCNNFPRGRSFWNLVFRGGSRLNWYFYRAFLLARYQNRHMADPLPFTSAFFETGINFPADLVQVHDLPGLEAGLQLANEWKVPLVYDAHELYPEQRSFSMVQRKICSEEEARLIKQAHLVFAVNESIANEMAKRYQIAKPISLLNAIDPPQAFNPSERFDLLRNKLSLTPDRRILLFQGGYSPHRNLEKLIEAMRFVKTRDVDLVLMGFGVFGDKLNAIANRYGLLNHRVYFLPAVSQSELLQHSASADVGIIPYPHVDLNSYYCTPNKLFEFIQAGLPILANDSPELRRFVADKGFGVVKPLHTARQIATAIDETFASNELSVWKNQVINHRVHFSWNVQSTVYLNAMLPFLSAEASIKPAEEFLSA